MGQPPPKAGDGRIGAGHATLRLFVALDPSEEVREGIREAVAPLRDAAPNQKWADLDKLHLTLVFLGSYPTEQVAGIEAALADVAGRHPPFGLHARGAGTFGSSARPRVLWVGLGGDLDALASLQGEVEAALVPLGHRAEERPFHPHLTLARARHPRGDRELAAARDALATQDFGSFAVGELQLVRSVLRRTGAIHQPLAVWPLGGGPKAVPDGKV